MTHDEDRQQPVTPSIREVVREINRRGFAILREALARDDLATLYAFGVSNEAMAQLRALSDDAIAQIIETTDRALFVPDPVVLDTLIELIEADCSDEEIERRMTELQARRVRERIRRHTH